MSFDTGKTILGKLAFLNRYSLDAPLIAVLWQTVLARDLSVELAVYHHLILGSSVWLAYSADRFSEPFLPSSQTAKRYEAFKNSRRSFLFCWVACLFIAVCSSVCQLDSQCLALGFTLASLSLANFYLCFMESRKGAFLPCPKEVRTACILSLGCVLFPACLSKDAFPEILFFTVLLFLAFFMNCLYVSKWELHKDRDRGRLSCLQTKENLMKWLPRVSCFAFLVLVMVALGRGMMPHLIPQVFLVFLFVATLENLVKDDDHKRQAVDQGYWILPLALLGIVHVASL